MNEVIDVMALQRDKSRHATPIDYRAAEGKSLAPWFLFECGIKLNAQPLTIAMAAVIFHKFFKEVDASDYDSYLIATSTLYLSGKMKDDQLKIRDVINVAHSTLNRNSAPLELGDQYWSMRDGIVQAELLIMRVLKFEVNVEHPHKYMLHYLKSLQDWFSPSVWSTMPIAKTAAAFLQDFHHSPAILDYAAPHIAIACLSLALQIYGARVPLCDNNDDNGVWYHVFDKNLSKEKHWEIMEKVMDVYNQEPETS
ncbi:cyclin-Q [Ctenocephalides felis]|uniref:cyclin-Q n=1 Tax=Ctenocephalides felis TaxID=7515 RepID=UPI000E6E58BD|nr:cyclin-Q [Ctenocephalides felis]XP_026461651.1 cyclin-Q [Ctenocephalides felis]